MGHALQAARARWRRAHATAAAFVQQLDAAAAAEQFEEAAALQVTWLIS